jgi:hypothetical protein
MKILVALHLGLCLTVNLNATSISTIEERTRYAGYQNLPGPNDGTPNTLSTGGVYYGAGVGDLDNTATYLRTCLIISFRTNDLWRSMAAQEDASIILKLKVESLVNGGAPSPIHLSTLDVGRKFDNLYMSELFAFIDALKFREYGPVVNQADVGVVQEFDVTDSIVPYLDDLDFVYYGICFGLHVPVPSDDNIKNLTLFDLDSITLEIGNSVAVPAPEILISTAVEVEIDTLLGITYFIETSHDMITWTREPKGITGTGETVSVLNTTKDGQKFFRVVSSY